MSTTGHHIGAYILMGVKLEDPISFFGSTIEVEAVERDCDHDEAEGNNYCPECGLPGPKKVMQDQWQSEDQFKHFKFDSFDPLDLQSWEELGPVEFDDGTVLVCEGYYPDLSFYYGIITNSTQKSPDLDLGALQDALELAEAKFESNAKTKGLKIQTVLFED